MVAGTSRAEHDRLETLRRFAVLDTPAEAIFDRITQLVARLFDVPIALVSLLDEERQWFKSRVGLAVAHTARDVAFCDHAIRGDGVLVVRDAREDARFSANPLVTGDSAVRFYAGAPLVAADGSKLGTVCVLDRKPRTLDATQQRLLVEMSELVMMHFEMRLAAMHAEAAKNELAAVIDASPVAIVTCALDGAITGWNAAATRTFGWTASETLGLQPHNALPEMAAEAAALRDAVVGRGEALTNHVTRRLRADGTPIDVSISGRPILDTEGKPTGGAFVVEDVTERKRARALERYRYEILESAASDAPLPEILDRLVAAVEYGPVERIGSILLAAQGRLRHAACGTGLEPAYVAAIDGVTLDGALFGSQPATVPDVLTDAAWAAYRDVAAASGLRSCWSVPIRGIDGRLLGTIAVYGRVPGSPEASDLRALGEAAQVAAVAIEAKEARAALHDLALNDALTGLPNRAAFNALLEAALVRAKAGGTCFAVGLLDLNGFKEINDRIGHAAGDELLRDFACRARGSIRAGDVVARMGGDEFLFLFEGVCDAASAGTAAGRLLEGTRNAFSIFGTRVTVGASLGLSRYPDDAREAALLVRHADAAMYAAKACGGELALYGGKPHCVVRTERPAGG